MEVTAFGFLIFLAIALFVYYRLPVQRRWGWLLAAGLFFVLTYNPAGLLFILLSSWLIWALARKMESNSTGGQYDKKTLKKKNRTLLLITVTVNVGILFVLKYLGSYLGILSGRENPLRFLIPVGLSYYTLQAIGYTMDVYWGRIPAESSYARVLLFLSYFPQMLQGPISRYRDLSGQFLTDNRENRFHNLKHGVQLMLWGYLKVLVIGARTGTLVNQIFHGPEMAYGLTVLAGFVLFGLQLYCNFSGGIDIVRGVSQCFGIVLPENFTQPFFSGSLGEFWRRWHITLGAWMKDYVFFPLSMSKPLSKAKKKLRNHMSRDMATRLVIALCNVAVFLIVGIWHGTTGNYALWGLYNGLILAGAELLEPAFARIRPRLGLDRHPRAWHGFCIFRTFLIVTLGWCTDCAATFAGSLQLVGNMLMVTRTNPALLHTSAINLAVLAVGVGVLLLTDLAHEKKISLRDVLDRKPVAVQMIFWICVIQFIAMFREIQEIGGFIYAQF